jgi:uncharacterized membrane protein
MRKTWDRARHAILFEVVLLGISILVLNLILKQPSAAIGKTAVILTILAMLWNAVYNYVFDRLLLALKRPLYPRGFWLRAAHSITFELGFMLITVPMVMFQLGLNLWEALLFDLGYVVGVPIYALLFNWLYDVIFPAPSSGQMAHAGH